MNPKGLISVPTKNRLLKKIELKKGWNNDY